MDNNIPTEQLKRRYKRLKARLEKVGLILQGTITERTIAADDPDSPGSKKAYGPYYQWTYKHKGKTKTLNLTASQAKVYQRAIRNHRIVEETLRDMRKISLRICEATTKGVTKRKPRNIKDLGLS